MKVYLIEVKNQESNHTDTINQISDLFEEDGSVKMFFNKADAIKKIEEYHLHRNERYYICECELEKGMVERFKCNFIPMTQDMFDEQLHEYIIQSTLEGYYHAGKLIGKYPILANNSKIVKAYLGGKKFE